METRPILTPASQAPILDLMPDRRPDDLQYFWQIQAPDGRTGFVYGIIDRPTWRAFVDGTLSMEMFIQREIVPKLAALRGLESLRG